MTFISTNAFDDGIGFILRNPESQEGAKEGGEPLEGGLLRDVGQGHLTTIAGRGGTAKSVLALQFLADLLARAKARAKEGPSRPAAFYFTLEASPLELARQLRSFRLNERYADKGETLPTSADDPNPADPAWSFGGLHIQALPSPIEDLSVLIRQVRQTIADVLANEPFDELVGVVIDPLGGVRTLDTMGSDIGSLKHLADSHQTYVFLLVEEHVYDEYRSIEHYSQTVLQLQHDPGHQPSRWIVVQKARSQPFRAGHHQLDLRDQGVEVFPSVEAESAYAHEKQPQRAPEPAPFLREEGFDRLQSIKAGAVIFLMGPPGTFKESIACNFATADADGPSLYISFKTDRAAIANYIHEEKGAVRPYKQYFDPSTDTSLDRHTTWFIEARNPLYTPQELLSIVRRMMERKANPRIRRAVVWGLRRLADMPNFAGSTAVQFLEALVTLLQVERTTCLLVDWPDIEKGNTLPIVDLSQYILLTRLCRSKYQLAALPRELRHVSEDIYGPADEPFTVGNAALLRVQRDEKGFHRDVGFVLSTIGGTRPKIRRLEREFQTTWERGGHKWEKDPSLS